MKDLRGIERSSVYEAAFVAWNKERGTKHSSPKEVLQREGLTSVREMESYIIKFISNYRERQ